MPRLRAVRSPSRPGSFIARFWLDRRWLTVALVIGLVSGLACAPSEAHAQQGTGSIVGKVSDTGGAVVVGANVIITNQATLQVVTVKANGQGNFASPPLASGLYTIEVEQPSFGPAEQKDFSLHDDQRGEVNFALKAGSVDQTVVVEARAPALNNFDATLGTVLDNSTAEALPLNGSNALALAQLDAGVVSAAGPVNEGFNDRGVGVSNIRIAGGLAGANANLLDGASNLQTTRGEILINSTVTGLAETRLQYGVVAAQYGLTSGGVVTTISRSGTAAFHGDLYEFFRNSYFNAAGYFALPGNKPVLNYNQYGVALGGPLKKDKAFFFVNFETYQNKQASSITVTVPTVAERGGDFSDQPNNIYDPTTSVPVTDPSTGKTFNGRTQFSGNMIPSTSFDPAAVAFQNAFIPLPNVGGPGTVVNNYTSNAPLISSQIVSLGRIDWQVNNHNSAFARYAFYDNVTNNQGSNGYLLGVASTRNDTLRNQDVTLGLTQVLSGTMLNDIRVAVGRSYFPFAAGSAGGNYPQQLGLSNVPQTTLPSISVTNYALGDSTNDGIRTSTIPEINDTVTLLRGVHSIHLGAGYRFYESYNTYNPTPSGVFSFSPATTGQLSTLATGTGNAYATFLIGKPGSVSAVSTAPSVSHLFSVNGFVQDDWRILSGLTLNLGFRYDFQAVPWEKGNGYSTLRTNQIDPQNGLVGREVYAGVNGSNRNFANENYADFAPRVGFAWLVSKKHQTVIRGGYAIYYAAAQNIIYQNATDGFGTSTTSYAAQTTGGYISQFSQGFPYAPVGLPGAAGGPGYLLGQSPTVQPTAVPNSMSQQFVFAVDHEFGKNTVLSTSFLENHGTHFPLTGVNLNQLDPKYFSLGLTALQSATANPYANDGITGSLGGKTLQVLQALKPFPYFQNVYEYYPHIGTFMGRSGQASIRRPVGHSFQLQLGYAYSKLLSDPLISSVSAAPTVAASLQNNYLPHSEYGIDPTDVTNRVSGNLTYTLPFGKGERFFNRLSPRANRFIGGFALAGTVVGESGRPLSFTGGNGAGATRPNFVPGVPLHIANPGPLAWFNTAAFAIAPPYSFGNVPRTLESLRGPGTLNINLNLMKTATFERYTGTFQVSAFNVLNKTNFSSPNTNYVAPSSTSTTTASAFGTITSAQQARNLQATVRIRF